MDRNYLAFVMVSALSLIIAFVSLPIIVQWYPPSSLKEFGVFTAVQLIIGTIIGLRHEMTIVASKSTISACQNVVVTNMLAIIISTIFYIIYKIFYNTLCHGALMCSSFGSVELLLVSSLIFLQFNIFYQLSIFLNNIRMLRIIKLTLVINITIAQLVLGYIGYTNNGLIYGYITGYFLTSAILCASVLHSFSVFKININHLMKRLKSGSGIYLYNLPEAFLNIFTANIPLLFLSYSLTDEDFAVVFICIKVLSNISNILVGASSTLFNARIRKNSNNLTHSVRANFIRDTIFLIIGCLAITAIPSSVFVQIFNSDFVNMKTYLLLLAPWFFARTVVSSVSYICVYIAKMKESYLCILYLSILRTVSYSMVLLLNPIFVVAIGGSLYYIVYGFFIYKTVRKHEFN